MHHSIDWTQLEVSCKVGFVVSKYITFVYTYILYFCTYIAINNLTTVLEDIGVAH